LNNSHPVILVTGAQGQLGSELKDIAASFSQYQFLFTTRAELAIDDHEAVSRFFDEQPINYCINCAAYTAVDKAETEKEKAFAINAEAVGHLAAVSKKHQCRLIHISTDYVFDGTACTPYTETDPPCPANAYGASKLKGEQLALQHDPSTIIIRSSWVYSSYGHNFVRTMMRLMAAKDSINVVNDQFGCPTYAGDLAGVIMQIIEHKGQWDAGDDRSNIFNYCNNGLASWYDLALAIKELSGSTCIINPIPTSQYPTAAKRPMYSALDTRKIRRAFNIRIPDWRDSLRKCMS
jgi:dTDP-4-dehydrorhamnose reductase